MAVLLMGFAIVLAIVAGNYQMIMIRANLEEINRKMGEKN